MKKILSLFIISTIFISCQDDVRFNNPGFQAKKDDVIWKSQDTRAYINSDGSLTVKAFAPFEEVILHTAAKTVGTYQLGTSNQNNFASYTSTFDDTEIIYSTIGANGPAGSVAIIQGGTGYSSLTGVPASGGSGNGLEFTTTSNSNGTITAITVSARGNGYRAGDVVTVTGGNANCRVRIVDVSNSNGEIKITNFNSTKMTVTGSFKFNADNVSNNPLGGLVVNYQYGEFYNIPIYPSE